MNLRSYKKGEEKDLFEVYYSAIHQVCIQHYTPEQIEAWAPKDLDPDVWASKMQEINPIVVLIDGKIVGYSDLQENGLIDHFFVHGDYQRRGVGKVLMTEILSRGSSKTKLHSEVSHTAKPFYESFGFRVVEVQTVEIRGAKLENNLMHRSVT